MDNKIKRFLNADEKVLWESRPQKVLLTETPHIFIAILRWVISITIVILSAKYFVYAQAMEIELTKSISVCVILALWALVIASRPFKDKIRLENDIRYIVTNQRMMAYSTSKANRVYYPYRKLDKIDEVTIIENKEGNATMYIGKPKAYTVFFQRSDLPVVPATDEDKPLIFYNIKNWEEVKPLIPSNAKVNFISKANPQTNNKPSYNNN